MEAFINNDSKSAVEAQFEAQKIAFAPVIFQVARSMRDLGVLQLLLDNDKTGLTIKEIANSLNISDYGIKTLIETALSSDIVKREDGRYFITKTGYYLLKDEMINVNMNFNHYVNYKGLYHLEEAIKEEKASGLQTLGNWDTIYPHLSKLPPKIKQSWFEFDHYYSDTAFEEAVDILLEKSPKKILDIGGNTGKFSIYMARKNKDVNITIFDLPGQVAVANQNIKEAGFEKRINFKEGNILDHSQPLPKGYDIIWMSQFLDCFKEEDIVTILKRAKEAMNENTLIYIMEPLWDRQRFETSAYCIINTSPYFTALANGYSKMFNAEDMLSYVKQAGLQVVKEHDDVGVCQTILTCKANDEN